MAPAPVPEPKILTMDVYRFLHPRTAAHFYTLDMNEGLRAGYKLEGQAFRVLAAQAHESIPVYRCFNGKKHFVSRAPLCEGSMTEGQYGFIYSMPAADRLPIYRFYHRLTGDYLITANKAEGETHGYMLQEILGYSPQ